MLSAVVFDGLTVKKRVGVFGWHTRVCKLNGSMLTLRKRSGVEEGHDLSTSSSLTFKLNRRTKNKGGEMSMCRLLVCLETQVGKIVCFKVSDSFYNCSRLVIQFSRFANLIRLALASPLSSSNTTQKQRFNPMSILELFASESQLKEVNQRSMQSLPSNDVSVTEKQIPTVGLPEPNSATTSREESEEVAKVVVSNTPPEMDSTQNSSSPIGSKKFDKLEAISLSGLRNEGQSSTDGLYREHASTLLKHMKWKSQVLLRESKTNANINR